jgi:hypothetical protein
LFNSLIRQHHYLGYSQPVGEHLKYLAYAGGRVVACFAFASAPYALDCRDTFLGWSPENTPCRTCHACCINKVTLPVSLVLLGCSQFLNDYILDGRSQTKICPQRCLDISILCVGKRRNIRQHNVVQGISSSPTINH